MATNQNDDYEKLAKLLYPSIEASGNVYYGQTRKLTMDEVLKKNDLGFESYTSSDSFNNKYFCWKLGPLHDSFETFLDYTFGIRVMTKDVSTHTVTVNAFNTVCQIIDDQDGNLSYDSLQINQKMYGTFWAKYIIHTNNKTVDNILGSGDYNTYEKDISIELSNIVCTYYVSPIDGTFVNDRNFIVDNDNSCIYIKICNSTDSTDDEYIEPEYTTEQLMEPVTISVKSGSVDISLLRTNTNNELYYKKNNEELLLIPKQEFRSVSLVSGDKLYLSGKHNEATSEQYGDFNISTENTSNDCEIELYGNINVLLNKDHPIGVVDVPAYAFVKLFNNFNADFDSSALILPAKALNEGCYSKMFANSNIIKAPENLPAEDIPSHGYEDMFNACAKLTTVPKLPHLNNLQTESLSQMFGSCTSLVKAYDKIEFTSSPMAIDSFNSMFASCTSLISAPKLPSEPIGTRIYNSMFASCTSLISAPKLSTIRNIESITPYVSMFYGCTSLQFVACNADSDFDINNGSNWLNNVSSTGVFYKNDNNNLWTSGPAGIPEGWTIKNWSELPADPVNGFNIQYLPDPEYTNKVLLTSGVDSSDNGRGILSNGTVYNMTTLFDEDSKHQINTCNKSSGSYNQDVWGYKTFNSPIKFRNGIYGETASLIATTSGTGENVTRLSLYDCNIIGSNDSDLTNNPHIQLGYTVDSESNKSESVIELKANKIVIDGTLETSGSSGGLIPFIPATKGPDVQLNHQTYPPVGELLHVIAQCADTTGDSRWDNNNSSWVYLGFPVIQQGEYEVYYNSLNDHRVAYARFEYGIEPSPSVVFYSDNPTDDFNSWDYYFPQGVDGQDESTCRYGYWQKIGTSIKWSGMDYDSRDSEAEVDIYENAWAAATTCMYCCPDCLDQANGKGDYGYSGDSYVDDSFKEGNYYVESYDESYRDLPYTEPGDGPWERQGLGNGGSHNVYYNAYNNTYKIYNDSINRYYEYSCSLEDITNPSAGYDDTAVDTANDGTFISDRSSWKPMGVFYNSSNIVNANKYCRNFGYEYNSNNNTSSVVYYNSDNGNKYIYNSTQAAIENNIISAANSYGPTGNLSIFTNNVEPLRANVHYGTVLMYNSNSGLWQLGNYNVRLYNVWFSIMSEPQFSIAFDRELIGGPSLQNGAKIVALSSAQTDNTTSLPTTAEEGVNMFYAQRIE